MSFLAMAFGLGALAIGFPLLFHLIRRTPKGRQEFSSLMFLKPSPPNLTRRSRLDHWLLLLLRALAIAFLAFAFMRPFFRENVNMSRFDLPARRVAIVLDTSGSMSAGDLWEKAIKEVNSILASLDRDDDVALITFGADVDVRAGFDNESTVGEGRKLKIDALKAELKQLRPGWSSTSMAEALIVASESLENASAKEKTPAASQIILVSDMQNGAEIQSLQSYTWPSSIRVDIRQVATKESSNASVRVLKSDESNTDGNVRVRVNNSADSNIEQFFVGWAESGNRVRQNDAVPFYVPPGTSMVLEVPRSPQQMSMTCISLTGDKQGFDNEFHVAPMEPSKFRVVYFGDENPFDADMMLDYLDAAYAPTPRREVVIEQVLSGSQDAEGAGPKSTFELAEEIGVDDPSDVKTSVTQVSECELEGADLVFVSGNPAEKSLGKIEKYVASGGSVFVVAASEKEALALKPLIGEVAIVESQKRRDDRQDYALLGELDFQHPLLVKFAGSKFNDFTKIHFWNHVSLAWQNPGPGFRVVASFDNGSPALVDIQSRVGHVYVLTSSWAPEFSQLALSSKFVPLMNIVLSESSKIPITDEDGLIGESLKIPQIEDARNVSVQRPDGVTDPLDPKQTSYQRTDVPGVYTVNVDDRRFRFAFNIDPDESLTAPMPVEKLKSLGVLTGIQSRQSERLEQMQLLKDKELESRQKIWKWLIVASIVFLLIETWLSGRAARKQARSTSQSHTESFDYSNQPVVSS